MEEFFIIFSVVYNLIILHLKPPLKCCILLENKYLIEGPVVFGASPSWLGPDENWFSKTFLLLLTPIIPFDNVFAVLLTSVFESVT